MENGLFRKKSIERVSSPELLNDYMRVATPSVWLLLIAAVLLLAGLIVWSFFASIESRAYGSARVKDGTMAVTFENKDDISKVEAGMTANIGGDAARITYVGYDTGDDDAIIGVDKQIPDGEYDFYATYRVTRVMEMLFN